jgi:prepilin-type N-terminal cleavage/methylation domain
MILSQKKCNPGFTLIEILIAVAIVGLFMAIAGPAAMQMLKKSRMNAMRTGLRGLRSTIEMYNADTGVYPDKLTDLLKCPSEELKSKWMGGDLSLHYVDKLEKDPWNHDFVYERKEYNGNPYTLYSHGPDGTKSKVKFHVWDLK